MKIAVMGAGSVGCYFGGMLARAGHDVTLIGRAAHVQAIRRDGLLLDTQTFCEHVRVRAESDASAVKDAELVLFCVKSIDTGPAAAIIAPHLAEGAVVLSLQNGVDNAQRLESVLRQRVADICRRRLAGAYSGESLQTCACAMLGNSRITTRFGDQLPSSVSIRPPRARKRPPYTATVAGESFLYSSNSTGSVISISLMT